MLRYLVLGSFLLLGSVLAQNDKIFNDESNFPEQQQQQQSKDSQNIDQLLKNPEFLEFFQGFQKHLAAKQHPIVVEVATTTEPLFFPAVQQPITTTTTTIVPQTVFFQQKSTQKPKRRPNQPKRVQQSRKRPTIPLPIFEAIPTTTEASTSEFNEFLARFKQPKNVPVQKKQLTRTQAIPALATRFAQPESKRIQANKPIIKPLEKNPDLSKYDEAVFRKQAESAKYEFASETDDTINENFHQRQEVRDGLAVRGQYSYSDGYYKRTVHYEADDKGFRIVKEDVEPIGNGPKFNPNGEAKVNQYVAGNFNNYHITKDDIQKRPTFEATVDEEQLEE